MYDELIICTNCGAELQLGQRFCGQCGQKIELINDQNEYLISSTINNSNNHVDSLISQGYDFLEINEWDKAYEFFNRAALADSTSFLAHLGIFLSVYKLSRVELIGDSILPYYETEHYKIAKKYAPSDMLELLNNLEIKSKEIFSNYVKEAQNDSNSLTLKLKEVYNFNLCQLRNFQHNINTPELNYERYLSLKNDLFYARYFSPVLFICNTEMTTIQDMLPALEECLMTYGGKQIIAIIPDFVDKRELLCTLGANQINEAFSIVVAFTESVNVAEDIAKYIGIDCIGTNNSSVDVVEIEQLFVQENNIVIQCDKQRTERIEQKQKAAIDRIEREQKANWIRNGLCRNCGGEFSGFLIKKCSKCGSTKDYILGKTNGCESCGAAMAMEIINEHVIDRYDSTKNVEQLIKNKEGKITGSYMQAVPATTYVSECIEKCKYCGYTHTVKKFETYRK